jgi:hypothetical protein
LKERIMRLTRSRAPKARDGTARQLGLANGRGGPDAAHSGVEFAV